MKKTRTVNIYVTAKDIATGVKGKCSACPVALAVSRALGEPREAAHGGFCWRVRDKKFVNEYSSPDTLTAASKVDQFIRDFDGGRRVQPMRFKLVVR